MKRTLWMAASAALVVLVVLLGAGPAHAEDPTDEPFVTGTLTGTWIGSTGGMVGARPCEQITEQLTWSLPATIQVGVPFSVSWRYDSNLPVWECGVSPEFDTTVRELDEDDGAAQLYLFPDSYVYAAHDLYIDYTDTTPGISPFESFVPAPVRPTQVEPDEVIGTCTRPTGCHGAGTGQWVLDSIDAASVPAGANDFALPYIVLCNSCQNPTPGNGLIDVDLPVVNIVGATGAPGPTPAPTATGGGTVPPTTPATCVPADQRLGVFVSALVTEVPGASGDLVTDFIKAITSPPGIAVMVVFLAGLALLWATGAGAIALAALGLAGIVGTLTAGGSAIQSLLHASDLLGSACSSADIANAARQADKAFIETIMALLALVSTLGIMRSLIGVIRAMNVEGLGLSGQMMGDLKGLAKKYDARILIKPRSERALELLRNGALPKEEWLKVKSISQADIDAGLATADELGKIIFREPTPVSPTDPGYGRYLTRLEEYRREIGEMQDAVTKGRCIIDSAGNVLRDGHAFTGDVDLVNVTQANGQPLDPEKLKALMQELYESDANVLHGAFEHWEEDLAGRSEVTVGQIGNKLIEIVGKNAPKLITYRGL